VSGTLANSFENTRASFPAIRDKKALSWICLLLLLLLLSSSPGHLLSLGPLAVVVSTVLRFEFYQCYSMLRFEFYQCYSMLIE